MFSRNEKDPAAVLCPARHAVRGGLRAAPGGGRHGAWHSPHRAPRPVPIRSGRCHRGGERPEVVSRYTRRGSSQGELRSHGFFYKPDGDDTGTLGLPISVPGRAGYKHLFQNSAAILFLRNDSLQFREVGELGSQPEKAINDQCRASCIDWYGNARPLFLRGRVFALLGYEIVEGKLDDGRMTELRRINYF